MVFASASDDEAEVVTADAGFGAKRFGAVEVEVGFAAIMLVDAVAGLGEKILVVFGTSLDESGFKGEVANGLLDIVAVLGTKRLDA